MSHVEFISRLGLPAAFPTFFPSRLEQYRRSLSEATDTPDEYAVAYMLGAGATAVGGNVSACVQPGWCVRANLFVAVIGFKGSGKSTLADKVFSPLARYEDELKERAEFMADDYDDDTDDSDDEDDDGDGDGGGRRRAKLPEPCVIVNDCTGPAVLRLLELNERQLLVNPDELSAQFIRNTGGTDRQMWCELYDGRRRRRERASSRSRATTLSSPYVSVLGGIQPDLFRCAYGQRGDDGLLDRLLLVGDGVARPVSWPRNADDPALNDEWSVTIDRLLHIEELASDSLGVPVESRFTPDALETCQQLEHRLNQLIVLIGVPESQYGIVAKLRQHAVKLALLRRCFRWAAGEFGEHGPMGDVDADDAAAACDATLFFLGRWLIWRPELRSGQSHAEGSTIGLRGEPGEDPALQALAAMADGAQRVIRLIEQLVRYVRYRGTAEIAVDELAARDPLARHSREELRDACQWLVDQGQGEWVDEPAGRFRLFEIPQPRGRRRRGRAALPAGSA
jgi:hypothetical protein